MPKYSPHGQHPKTFQFCAAVMIKNPGQKFDNLRTGSIIGAVVKDQNFLSRITGEQIKEVGNLDCQGQHEMTPIMARILQQRISCILLEWQSGVGDDSSIKIVALKRQHEDNREKCQRRYTSQFPYSTFIEQRTNLKLSDERRNSTLQLICFLLLLMLFGNIYYRPSLLILLMFSQKPIYHEAKGVSVIIVLFQSIDCLLGNFVHNSES